MTEPGVGPQAGEQVIVGALPTTFRVLAALVGGASSTDDNHGRERLQAEFGVSAVDEWIADLGERHAVKL